MNIVFLARFCMPLNKKMVEEEGMGGSESALCFCSRTLSLLGNKVEVYCPASSLFEIDGVIFKPIEKFFQDKWQKADLIISFRDVELCLIKQELKTKVVLWLHDDYSKFWFDKKVQAKWLPIILNNADRIFAIGKWQKNSFNRMFGCKIPESTFFLTKNGMPFECEQENTVTRDPLRLAYTSVLNRGFKFVPEILQRLKKSFPEIRLDVCTSYPEEIALYPEIKNNITFLGKLDRKGVKDLLSRSSLLIYPNHPVIQSVGYFGVFGECCSISSIESQACGTPVVSSERCGLAETIMNGTTGVLIPGDPLSSPDYLDQFVSYTKDLLNDPDRIELYRRNARAYALKNFSWKTIANAWIEELEKLLSE